MRCGDPLCDSTTTTTRHIARHVRPRLEAQVRGYATRRTGAGAHAMACARIPHAHVSWCKDGSHHLHTTHVASNVHLLVLPFLCVVRHDDRGVLFVSPRNERETSCHRVMTRQCHDSLYSDARCTVTLLIDVPWKDEPPVGHADTVEPSDDVLSVPQATKHRENGRVSAETPDGVRMRHIVSRLHLTQRPFRASFRLCRRNHLTNDLKAVLVHFFDTFVWYISATKTRCLITVPIALVIKLFFIAYTGNRTRTTTLEGSHATVAPCTHLYDP